MKNFIIAMLCIILLFLIFTAQKSIDGPFRNTMLKGWLFTSGQYISGERVWAKADTLDTLVISNIDTTCAVFLQTKTTTIKNLTFDIRSAGDTIFVESDSAGVASTDKYCYFIMRNAYNASD